MPDEEKSKPAPGSGDELDLRGVPCPLSWARTKVRLAELAPGDALTVRLDDPKGVRDLPRAAEAEGYAVDEPVGTDGAWLVRITV